MMDNFKETFSKQMNDIVSFEWNNSNQDKTQAAKPATISGLAACSGKAFKIKKATEEKPVVETASATVKQFQQRPAGTVENKKVQPQHRR